MSDWAEWRQKVDLEEYDARWQRMEATGEAVHGEADLVMSYGPKSVLDGGCGTGRVGIELASRGVDVVGADLDGDFLARARAKAPELLWHLVDLADLALEQRFDVVVLAGNVVRFIDDAQRPAAMAACARHLQPGGRLIVGFQLGAPSPTLDNYDRWCTDASLVLESRFAAWNKAPFVAGGDYAVSVHLAPVT